MYRSYGYDFFHMVGELSTNRRRNIVNCFGDTRGENADMSNDKRSEKLLR